MYIGKNLAGRYVIELDSVYELSLELCCMSIYQTLHFLSLSLEILEGFGVKRNSKPVLFVTGYMIHRWAQLRCGGKTVFSNTLAYLCLWCIDISKENGVFVLQVGNFF